MTTQPISPLRQRMIEDMNARKLGRHCQRSHLYSCERFAAFLQRSPETATADDVRRFQLHLAESGISICNRNRIMTGVKFLFRVTLRRHDLAAEIYHLKEPLKLPLIMSPSEARNLHISGCRAAVTAPPLPPRRRRRRLLAHSAGGGNSDGSLR
jgi:site-specific recombinase XerD